MVEEARKIIGNWCRGSMSKSNTSWGLLIHSPCLRGSEHEILKGVRTHGSPRLMYYDILGLISQVKYMDMDKENGGLDKHLGHTFLSHVLWWIRMNILSLVLGLR